MKIMSVVGARPNFMKIAPFVHAIEEYNRKPDSSPIESMLVHTGQHYDNRLSGAFIDALDIPRPNIHLGIGSGSHAEQVGKTMMAFEKVLRKHKPDWVVVVGDVNATCACSITAKKEHIKLAHIEAGLRSFDLEMPEEINRMVTDRLSDLLFTTDELSCRNLLQEGVPQERIKFVGNIMIDTLETHRFRATDLTLADVIARNRLLVNAAAPSLVDNGYAVLTIHRPSNVDEKKVLKGILKFLLDELLQEIPLVWPIHPRTLKKLKLFGLWESVKLSPNLIFLHPTGYHDMLRLNLSARLMLTDSGGLQEECCILGTPCITLRRNTERPVTLREHGGINVLVGNDIKKIRQAFRDPRNGTRKPSTPPLWDGHTADRIVDVFAQLENEIHPGK